MKDLYTTLPTQGELSILLLKTNCDAKFQDCLRKIITPCAGQSLSSSAIAIKFKLVLEELMIDATKDMKPYFRNRLCEVISIIIKQQDIADQSKMIFKLLSS
ncbi:MAG: hypothetical protein Q8T08_17515 [Ignavibacteria bacterium]|nr:hypothetical protein [Ignavibacteria bacterium]